MSFPAGSYDNVPNVTYKETVTFLYEAAETGNDKTSRTQTVQYYLIVENSTIGLAITGFTTPLDLPQFTLFTLAATENKHDVFREQ